MLLSFVLFLFLLYMRPKRLCVYLSIESICVRHRLLYNMTSIITVLITMERERESMVSLDVLFICSFVCCVS